jgi:hypothetical protein
MATYLSLSKLHFNNFIKKTLFSIYQAIYHRPELRMFIIRTSKKIGVFPALKRIPTITNKNDDDISPWAALILRRIRNTACEKRMKQN